MVRRGTPRSDREASIRPAGGDRAGPRDGGALRGAARGGARMTELLQIAPEVEQVLHEGGPVVALETTLIAHGFPPGVGVEVGHASEAAVRAEGAVAATVGVIDGALVGGAE